jgi:hypothetical protein
MTSAADELKRTAAAESCAAYAEAKWLEYTTKAAKAWNGSGPSWFWPSRAEQEARHHRGIANEFDKYYHQCIYPRASASDIAYTQRLMEHYQKGVLADDDS